MRDIAADFKNKIRDKFSELSAAQKNLAEYLLHNGEKAAFLTASRLGAVVGVSESTVIRFAYTLGYQGYPELQSLLQEMVKNQLTTVNWLRFSTENFKQQSVLREIMETDLENLRQTLHELSDQVFSQAVQEIIQARKVYLLGFRSAHSLALFLGFYLEFTGKDIKVVPGGVNSVFEQLVDAGPEDLVIGISFPRYTKATIESFAFVKKRGAKTLAITDSVISPLAQLADLTLTAKSNLGSFIESFAAPLSLINALVTAIGRTDQDKTLVNLEKLESIWEKYQIFYLPETRD